MAGQWQHQCGIRLCRLPAACILQVVLDGELLGETPVHARVKPASLKVLIPPPPVADDDAESAEEGAEAVNDEGSGAASQPDGAAATPLTEASAQVENKPIVAHEPNKE